MRQKYSFLNIITGLSSQLILMFLGLLSRKIFVDELGLQILGINGLMLNIISMLSLTELGIGTAIFYSLYKPLANNDYSQVRATMLFYSKLYKYIALAVACIGIMIIPFLQMFIKESINNSFLIFVFLCFLTDTVLSYILAYKKNIIVADQKSYIITTVQTCFTILLTIVQILIIIKTHSFILYLVAKIVIGVGTNIVFHFVANRMYPYLKNKSDVKLNDETKNEIIKNAKALFISSLACYFVFGTGNILISLFVGINAVGLYSNYSLIVGVLQSTVGQVFNGIRASFGNILITESMTESYNKFKIMFFLNFWISSLCSVLLVVLLNPFIELWIGIKALLPFHVVIIIVSNFYLVSLTKTIDTARNAAGLYSPYPFFKYWALTEGVINLILGVILAGFFKMGIMGILLAATISTSLLIFVLPWNLFKYVFKIPFEPYLKSYFIYLICTISMIFVLLWLCNLINIENNIYELLIKGATCFVFTNLTIILLFYKSNEFIYIWEVIKKVRKSKI